MKYFSVSVEFIINSPMYTEVTLELFQHTLCMLSWFLCWKSDIFIEWPIYLFVKPFDQNFVGLSISDGYIATGSETNEVCIP